MEKSVSSNEVSLDIDFVGLTCYNREAWRYTGPFTRAKRFRGAFPGLGLGAGAFAIYLVAETLLFKDDHSHGEEQHH